MTAPTRPAAGAGVFHPERLIAVLGRFKVRYVLTGSVAQRLHGFPWMVAISEIVPARDAANMEALATALKHLSAQVYTDGTPEGLPFEITAAALAVAEEWSFVTMCGRLDVRLRPGGFGYDALEPAAASFQLHGDALRVASLRDIIRLREAEAQPADQYEIGLLKELFRRTSSGAGQVESAGAPGAER